VLRSRLIKGCIITRLPSTRSGDPVTGVFGDAKLIRKFGDVPDDLSGL
jgi:hypothetical protein